MQTVMLASVQPRMHIVTSREEFESEVRRFLRLAQAKASRITVFPELMGVMMAPPLVSRLKLGLVRRADEGRRAGAGFLARRLGRVAGTTAGAIGGGFRGSLDRLLKKNADVLLDLYLDTFGSLAREYGTAIVAGSLYVVDKETGTVRNRAFVFDVDGELLGTQDKVNLDPDERGFVSPGSEVQAIETRFGRIGLLIGRDALYPELARILAMQGADLLVGVAASPGVAQSAMIRNALALRAEENQVFVACSFMLGPNMLGSSDHEMFYGKSALLSPISLSYNGDGILIEAGTNNAETFIAAEVDGLELDELRDTSRFQPRRDMCLGGMGPVLAQMYEREMSIEEAISSRIALSVPEPVEPAPIQSARAFEPVETVEHEPEMEELVSESTLSVPEMLVVSDPQDPEE